MNENNFRKKKTDKKSAKKGNMMVLKQIDGCKKKRKNFKKWKNMIVMNGK